MYGLSLYNVPNHVARWKPWGVVPSEKLCEHLVVNSPRWAPHLWLSGPGGAWTITGRNLSPFDLELDVQRPGEKYAIDWVNSSYESAN